MSTRFFTIATSGHVDHGKTTLIKKLTGIDPDRLKEEKERQMTVDLGFAYLGLDPSCVLGFVDVPGHGKFLKNMLAGVGGIDFALVVVAADEGPMPQTKQHIRILSLLGVEQVFVVLTKIDLVNKERLAFVEDKVKDLLAEHKLGILHCCAVSALSSQGLVELKQALYQAVNSLGTREDSADLFLPIDRVFKKSGFGVIVTGTVVSGTLVSGSELVVEPGDVKARVRRLETHGQIVEQALPGQRVACNLVVKGQTTLIRGQVLSRNPLLATKSMLVSIVDRPSMLDGLLSKKLSNKPLRLYHGTAEHHGCLRWVEDIDQEDGCGFGKEGLGLLVLQEPAIVSAQDKFILRFTDDTVCGGTILIKGRPTWLNKQKLLETALLLREKKFDEAVCKFINNAPQMLLKEEQLALILKETVSKNVLAHLFAQGKLVKLGQYLLNKENRLTLSDNLYSKLKQVLLKLDDPGEGVGQEELRQALWIQMEKTAFQCLIEEECVNKRIIRHKDKVLLPGIGGQQVLTFELQILADKMGKELATHWCLTVDELAGLTGTQPTQLKNVIQALAKSGAVTIVSYDFVASKQKLKEAHELLAVLWHKKHNIAPTDFKEALGTTRKYAMALLQYFDDQKVTRRLQSGRVLLREP